MGSQNGSTGQENEGDQQPSEMPFLSEKGKSQETSDHVPPLPSLSQQEAETRHTLTTGPFQPILKVLADLERDDPKFVFPVARLVRLYRRLWESCVSKHVGGQKLEQENLVLKEAGTHLKQKRDGLQVRQDKQLARLRFFEQALESSRERLFGVLDDWDHPLRLNLTGFLDNARGE